MTDTDLATSATELVETIGVTLVTAGVAGGLTYLYRPHPLVPPVAAATLACGLGLLCWSLSTKPPRADPTDMTEER